MPLGQPSHTMMEPSQNAALEEVETKAKISLKKKIEAMESQFLDLQRQKQATLEAIKKLTEPNDKLSKLAKFWGECSLMMKIFVGILLCAPLIIAGVLAHLYILIPCGVGIGLIYASSGAILSGVYKKDKKITDSYNQAWETILTHCFDILNCFDSVIKNFNQIYEDFDLLREQFNNVLLGLIEENNKLGIRIVALGNFTNQLISSHLKSEEERQAFQERLYDFLNDKQKSFDCLIDRICEAEEKLAEVTKQLHVLLEKFNANNEHQEALLDRQEKLFNTQQLAGFQNPENQRFFPAGDVTVKLVPICHDLGKNAPAAGATSMIS